MGILPPILALIIMVRKWKNIGKDPKGRGIIVPQYSVPKGVNPLLADVVLNERLQTKAISATILDLAIKGYLKLYEVEKKKLLKNSQEYELELIKPTSNLSLEEQKVITMLFPSANPGEKINLNDLKNKLYKDVKSEERHHYHQQKGNYQQPILRT